MKTSFLPLTADAPKSKPPLPPRNKQMKPSKPTTRLSRNMDKGLSISTALVTLVTCFLWLRHAHLGLEFSFQNPAAAKIESKIPNTTHPLNLPPFGTLVMYCNNGKWYGRTGNNIISVLSAALKARILGMDLKIFDCSHDILDLSQYTLDPGTDLFPNYLDIKDTLPTDEAFTMFLVSTKMRIFPKETCCLRRQILAPLLKKITSSPASSKYHPDSLIIHIRSGDIFRKDAHPDYAPPPLAFYKRVIDEHQSKHSGSNKGSIVIVTEMESISPLVDALLKLYPQGTITLQAGTLEEDVAVVLAARHLIASQGTFAYSLALASHNLETLYIFNKNLDTRIYCDVDVVQYKAVLSPSLEKWAATAEQIQYLLNFPAHNITRTVLKSNSIYKGYCANFENNS